MKNTARRIGIIAASILIGIGAFFAVGSAGPVPGETPQQLKLVYHATFGNGWLASGVDRLGIGPLKLGDSLVADTAPTWTAHGGAITVGITRPLGMIVGPVSAGIFATPVNFDQGSVFGLRATFIAPVGPHSAGNTWAVGLQARTGGQDDLFAETRTAATFHVRANSAKLNVVGASAPPILPNVPQEIYDAIFDPIDPLPFTLELVINRQSGLSVATLKTGSWINSHVFQPAVFQASSGPSITAVGISIAVSNAPGQSASVDARDFQIFSAR